MSFESSDSEDPALVFPQHECGLFAVFGHPNAAVLTYYGLFALQHRGQESAGIVTSTGPGKTFLQHKGMGLVSQVFGQEELAKLTGTRALGHTRYSTTGGNAWINSQPLIHHGRVRTVALGHNGNLVNAAALRTETGKKLASSSDSEVIAALIAARGGDRRGDGEA